MNCELCNRSFRSVMARNNHVAASQDHPLCVTCSRRFIHDEARRNHYINSSRHFYCENCDRHFVDGRALEQHVMDSYSHRNGVQGLMMGPPSTYRYEVPPLASVSSDEDEDVDDDPSEFWASDSDIESQSEDERLALSNAIGTMTISPAMRQEAMQGYPVWSGGQAEVESYASDSEDDDDGDEIEGYNSEDFDSSDSEGSLPNVDRIDLPPGYGRGQVHDARNTSSSASSSSTLDSVGPAALTKYENGTTNGKANMMNPNSFIVYTCPLCMDEGGELSSLACGHVFCSSCTKRALHAKRQCPLCRQPARMRDIRRIYLTC